MIIGISKYTSAVIFGTRYKFYTDTKIVYVEFFARDLLTYTLLRQGNGDDSTC